MKYALLIYGSEQFVSEMTAEEGEKMLEKHLSTRGKMEASGEFVGSARLEPTHDAVTVSADEDGYPLVTDGPFAETKEQFLGYYVVECESIEKAAEYAKGLPLKKHKVEVRPIGWCL
ncbi:YciI family protein [Parasalinivibrio latis]|uniref:YciI family protein n=1 Tax=Parasalinivibrio latis TaxID=2952610 RepID=UPI0030DE584E